MPPRNLPTLRQRRVGAELRRMREAAGLNVGESADRLGIERTTISNIEAGRLGVSDERIKSLARVYQCPDRSHVDALVAMVEERGRGWWEEYRGKLDVAALDLAELHQRAVRVRVSQVMHFPGLLQTEEYAKAVLSLAVPEPTAAELRRSLSFRMRRRDVLDEESAPDCVFLIHEAALRLEFGGRTVMLSQLNHVLEASERPNVTVRVIPFAAGGFPNAGSSINYAHGLVPQLDTVHFDTQAGISFLDAPSVLRKYRDTLDRIEGISLSAGKTRDFLRDVATHP